MWINWINNLIPIYSYLKISSNKEVFEIVINIKKDSKNLKIVKISLKTYFKEIRKNSPNFKNIKNLAKNILQRNWKIHLILKIFYFFWDIRNKIL
jgi:hypothetical protein